MTRTLLKSIFSILLLLGTQHTVAGVFKWVDENGRVHYSDKPVGDKATTVDIAPPPPRVNSNSSDNQDRKTRANKYLRARELERAEIEQKQKEKKRLQAERKVKCKAAKKEYRRQIRAQALYYENKDGSRTYLENNERKKSHAEAKAEVKKWCK